MCHASMTKLGSRLSSLNEAVLCDIPLLGKVGHGESALGNRILDREQQRQQISYNFLHCANQHLSSRMTYSMLMPI